jgi:uncharacterized protein (TIGR02145 family)
MNKRKLLTVPAFLLLLVISSGCDKNDTEPYKGQSDAVFNPDKSYGIMTDIDGNEYRTIQIGNQTWMAQNLRVKHFRNGDPITARPEGNWFGIEEPAYCAVNNCNHPDSTATFGLLYNGYVVADERQIAPEGWRLPTKEDLFELIDHLNTDEGTTHIRGNTIVGGMLNETGNKHWKPFNLRSDNSSGLTLLPTGYRVGEKFSATTTMASLYTTTYYDSELKIKTCVYSTFSLLPNIDLMITGGIVCGRSIRCIKE